MPVDDLGKLGMRMRAARNEMGLTQQRLSDMCHVSIREIAKIENGEMNPSFLILKTIIQVLKLPDFLLSVLNLCLQFLTGFLFWFCHGWSLLSAHRHRKRTVDSLGCPLGWVLSFIVCCSISGIC